MAKTKSAFFCTECGYESPKWMGRCPACGQWNTMTEEKYTVSKGSGKKSRSLLDASSKAVALNDIEVSEEQRMKLPSAELNRVLGGGLVAGSLTLIGGEPGIGKSTLLLQNVLSVRSKKILYVSGEESATQLKLRADRLGKVSDNTYILCETNLDTIFDRIEELQPQFLVVDSIQTVFSPELESAPGSVGQVRECAVRLLRYAKSTGVPVLLVGHINKEGAIAGPKVLEHIVDTVLLFEGDRQYLYRLLRSAKNRFGSTSEIGIYEMASRGLREVSNPSEMLLSSRATEAPMPGTAVGVIAEGARPMLVEVQALVGSAAYGTPQRSVTGFDQRRLNMLLAVLEKRARFRLAQKDVFLNIAGGLKVADPALDLAVVAAVMSSDFDMALPPDTTMAGEIGLTGEIRPVPRMERRVAEASRHGFNTIYIPKGNLKGADMSALDIEIVEISRIDELLRYLFTRKA